MIGGDGMKLIKRVLKSAGEYRGRIIIGLIATVLKELSMGDRKSVV